MATLLFRLRHVPDDEANDIRALLDDNGIDFYETSAGNWGISMPALWLTDDEQLRQAQTLIDQYQQEHGQQQRQLHAEQRKAGELPGVLERCRDKPALALMTLAFCLFILYVSIKPFMDLINA